MTKRATTALLLGVWFVVIALSVLLCNLTKTTADSPHQEVMLQASALAQEAFDSIKQYKQQHDIELVAEDKLQTGMLGKQSSLIVTTDGLLNSKRTSINPHWSAVVVSMFVRAKLKPGDQVLMVFSGSFPALNICAIAAGQAYGLDMCLMGSIGASNYGATDEEFTFFDMTEHLYNTGVFTSRLDCVSLGGSKDCGYDFGKKLYAIGDDDALVKGESLRLDILARARSVQEITVIEEPNFQQNMALRLDYINKNAPDIKFMLNVGGSMAGLGVGQNAHTQSGYISPGITINNGALDQVESKDGLLQRCLNNGIPVASLLNVKGLADEYGIAYDPDQLPDATDTSQSNVYFTTRYNFVIPMLALIVTVAVAVLFFVLRFQNKLEVKQDERNHILRRR